MRKFYGHSLLGKNECDWEPLEDHLNLVAEYAERFSAKMNAADWGRILGYWHDLGKYDERFQDYLLSENGFLTHLEEVTKINHSTFGGQHAIEQFTGRELPFGYLLAYCILGHHAGLPDYHDTNPDLERASSLSARLNQMDAKISLEHIPERVHQKTDLNLPNLNYDPQRLVFQLSFWTRMIFSCLVDADFLATEQFMSPERMRLRPSQFSLWKNLEERLQALLVEKSQQQTPLGQIRRDILNACLSSAEKPPGFFSLTVPTGGGKTLSSLAFAIKHLRSHGHDRIIYAIPFTSIVEQTAEVFRNVFAEQGENVVLEHHCNVDPDDERFSSRLATENWDAPLIVTTNVQLLESLFAAKPSRCRKLHRMANSVIILDEAQTLPVEYLQPCLLALQELVTNYNCTIVLCTATQPAVNLRDDFPIGLQGVREIIPEPQKLARQMKRVEISSLGPVTQPELAERLRQLEQFLCIVNYKADAANLFRQLTEMQDKAGLFHLSTNLCPQHRLLKLRQIRQRLQAGEPCRVISTQLIEAGVDVDFPVVYRALAGLDSIAQAAGRCNREGKRDTADVFVFEPTGDGWTKPVGTHKQSAQLTQRMLLDTYSPLHEHGWLATETISHYFQQSYWSRASDWDKKQVVNVECLRRSSMGVPEFQYREMARRFRLIDDYQIPVFVRYDDTAEHLLEQLRINLQAADQKQAGLERRQLLRKLQRYAVGVSPFLVKPMLGRDISVLLDHREEPTEFYELVNSSCYHEELGLHAGTEGMMSAEQLLL